MKNTIILLSILLLTSCTNSLIMRLDPETSAVEYRISGTAASVDVLLSNEDGIARKYDSVQLPKVYKYNDFTNNLLFVSAENNGTTGTVKIEIYLNGELQDQSESELKAIASYVIEYGTSK